MKLRTQTGNYSGRWNMWSSTALHSGSALAVKSRILATMPGIDSSRWTLELRVCEFGHNFLIGLDELFERAIDPNIFFSREFFSASYERIDKIPKHLLIIWEEFGSEKTPRLAFPLLVDSVGMPPKTVWRVASSPYAPLSTPLLHEEDHEGTVGKFIELLAESSTFKPDLLLFEDLETHSHFYRNLQSIAPHLLDELAFSKTSRSILKPSDIEAFQKEKIKSKRVREFRRQQKRLGELGNVVFHKSVAPLEILTHFEEFLLVETRGWKGRNRTALNDVRKTAAFARQAIANLAENNACHIHSLRLDDIAIASLIMFRFRDRYYPWKIAYDEAFTRYAPGLLLFWHATQDLLQTEGFEGADSLSAPKNHFTSEIWPDRMELTRLLIPLNNQPITGAQSVKIAIERKDRLKDYARWLLRKG